MSSIGGFSSISISSGALSDINSEGIKDLINKLNNLPPVLIETIKQHNTLRDEQSLEKPSHKFNINESKEKSVYNIKKEQFKISFESFICYHGKSLNFNLSIKEIKESLNNIIYDAKKKELIKPMEKMQLNLRIKSSQINENNKIIIKELNSFRRVYEEKAKSIFELINSINLLNSQLFEPLNIIKDNLKYISNIYKNKKDDINNLNNINEEINELKIDL